MYMALSISSVPQSQDSCYTVKNLIFLTILGKANSLVLIIRRFEKSRVKLRCVTGDGTLG